MTERTEDDVRQEIIEAIKDAIHNADFSEHNRKQKVSRGWNCISMDRELRDPISADFIRSGLCFNITNMLRELKDGKVIIPELHNRIVNEIGYGPNPSWRYQFVASSANGEYHVLVTMEQFIWDLEIDFEIEVEE